MQTQNSGRPVAAQEQTQNSGRPVAAGGMTQEQTQNSNVQMPPRPLPPRPALWQLEHTKFARSSQIEGEAQPSGDEMDILRNYHDKLLEVIAGTKSKRELEEWQKGSGAISY